MMMRVMDGVAQHEELVKGEKSEMPPKYDREMGSRFWFKERQWEL